MATANYKELLEAGCHFGHLTRKWNPNMAPYIFMEKNGIHIIDLNKTVAKLEEASAALNQIAKSGKKILFVATKKQAKDLTAQKVEQINMPFITERWSGGMLTNFATVRKAVRKLNSLEKMEKDGTFDKISKRERLTKSRQRDKLNKTIGSISDLNRLPAALFIVIFIKSTLLLLKQKS
jgi:small subunit ribosomal protein S2